MNDNGKPNDQENGQDPAPIGPNGLVALGMVLGTVAWIFWVIWG